MLELNEEQEWIECRISFRHSMTMVRGNEKTFKAQQQPFMS
jgi:uncharacterized Fe-S cluster protein YjdI